MFQSELKHQRKLVRSLKKKSRWSRNLEEIVEKLVDIVTYIHQAIREFLGNNVAAKDKKVCFYRHLAQPLFLQIRGTHYIMVYPTELRVLFHLCCKPWLSQKISPLLRSKPKWIRLFSGFFHLPQIQSKHIKVSDGLANGQTQVMTLVMTQPKKVT